MFQSKLKSFVRDYFTLTSRERRGGLALALIIIIQLFIIIWMNYIRSPELPDVQNYSIEIIQFEKAVSKQIADSRYKNKSYAKENSKADEAILKKLHPFNPNTISDVEWRQLGLTEYQIKIIRNFINKGGAFRDKESLSRIYSISPDQYAELEPYIVIPEKAHSSYSTSPNKSHVKKVINKININTADTIQLLELPLVGAGRARMIHKYRLALGGFYNQSQLLEVFTMDSSTLAAIAPHIFIDSLAIRKINFNSDTLKHPYLTKQLAQVIKAYRKQHGNFTHISELKHISLVNEQIYSKLVPYAAFE